MKKTFWSPLLLPVLALVLALAPSALFAQGRGRGQGKGNPPEAREGKAEAARNRAEAARESAENRAFGKDQERRIREWFGNPANREGLPPGLQRQLERRGSLPPGLQHHLEKFGTLPPGLQRRAQPLPRELDEELPEPVEGTRRVVVGGNVILLEERTAKILDIVQDVTGSGGGDEPTTGVKRR